MFEFPAQMCTFLDLQLKIVIEILEIWGKPTNVKERRCSPMSMGRSSLTSMNDGAH